MSDNGEVSELHSEPTGCSPAVPRCESASARFARSPMIAQTRGPTLRTPRLAGVRRESMPNEKTLQFHLSFSGTSMMGQSTLHRLGAPPIPTYSQIDPAMARGVAFNFLEIPSSPRDPKVVTAYAALEAQSDSLFAAIAGAVRIVFTAVPCPIRVTESS